VRRILIVAVSALALGLVAPSSADASPAVPAQKVVGIAGGTWTAPCADYKCEILSDREDGRYATGTQLGSGTYHLVQPDANTPSGTARFVRSDGLVLTGTFDEQFCNVPDDCRKLGVRLNGARDVASAQLTLSGTLDTAVTPDGLDEIGHPSYTVSGKVAAARQIGYTMLDVNGGVHTFGGLTNDGNAHTTTATGIAQTLSYQGYWIADAAGHVFSFGEAQWRGNADRSQLSTGETVTAISATPTGNGYWLFTTKGRVLPFGDARSYGDMHKIRLNEPVVGAVATLTGKGYYLVAKDGGIFGFGDAHFYGSMGNTRLNQPIIGLVPTPAGTGYWLVAADGGVFGFHAPFRGSLANVHLHRPIVTLVPYGNGYLMISADGGTFDFSTDPTFGNLAGSKLGAPIVTATAAG